VKTGFSNQAQKSFENSNKLAEQTNPNSLYKETKSQCNGINFTKSLSQTLWNQISKTCGVYERGGQFFYFGSYSLEMKRSLLMILGNCYVAVGARNLPSHMSTSNLKQYKNACFWYSRIMYRKMKGGAVPLYFFPLPLTDFFFLSNTISPLVRTGMVFRLSKPA
jgi:hypothetical protein